MKCVFVESAYLGGKEYVAKDLKRNYIKKLYKFIFFIDITIVLLYNTHKSDCMMTYDLMSI